MITLNCCFGCFLRECWRTFRAWGRSTVNGLPWALTVQRGQLPLPPVQEPAALKHTHRLCIRGHLCAVNAWCNVCGAEGETEEQRKERERDEQLRRDGRTREDPYPWP